MKELLKRHWLLVISLLYFIWPIDFIADLLGPIGLIDDFGLLLILIIKETYQHFKSHKKTESGQNVSPGKAEDES